MTKAKSPNEPAKKYGKRYPWEKWMRHTGRFVTLVRGVDFDCMVHGMAHNIRNHAAAQRPRLRVSVRIGEDSVTFKVVGVANEGPA